MFNLSYINFNLSKKIHHSLIFFIIFVIITNISVAKQMIWISGKTTANYGTKVVPHPSNCPPERRGAAPFIDAQENLYFFGGGVHTSSMRHRNDFWKFGQNWTWIDGSTLTDSSAGLPTAHWYASSWTDFQNRFSFFDGHYSETGIFCAFCSSF